MKISFFAILFLSLATLNLNCRSTSVSSPSATPLSAPKNFVALKSENLIESGQNSMAQYSDDGRRLIFISAERSSHRLRQAYEWNFSTATERRLTFQDGEVTDALYALNSYDFFYSSSTDEIKEEPEFLLLPDRKRYFDFLGREWPRTEIYFQSSTLQRISRLTRSSGFDGALQKGPRSNLTFISTRSGALKAFEMSFESKKERMLFANNLTKNNKREELSSLFQKNWQLTVVADFENKTSFIELIDLTSKEKVRNSKTTAPTPLTALKNWSVSPSVHPDGQWILFSSNSDDVNNFELYAIRHDRRCLTRLTYTAENELHAQFNPASKEGEFIFTLAGEDFSKLQRVKSWAPPACESSP